MYAYQIFDLKKGIYSIHADLKRLEKKYQMGSEKFYHDFEQGLLGDSEDYMVWAGLFEMFCDNKQRLNQMSSDIKGQVFKTMDKQN